MIDVTVPCSLHCYLLYCVYCDLPKLLFMWRILKSGNVRCG